MMTRKKILAAALGLTCMLTFQQVGNLFAQEVGKGEIPEAQLAASYKKLDWGVQIWDNSEAISSLQSAEKLLWVDTRPASFFVKGTVANAVNLAYDKIDSEGNTLSAESLATAITDAGLSKDETRIVFFCQGPKCHRSYNASYTAVNDWGYSADNVIWYRDGYPNLFSEVKADVKLKRKAARYISKEGIGEL